MELLRDYALSFVKIPYIWGGFHPANGYDCSGFVQELLRSVGIDPPLDQTAQALFDHFVIAGMPKKSGMGCLLFFGRSISRISHVAMALDNYRMIEAGGGARNMTREKAIKTDGAMVRIRLIKSRRDLQASIRPDYARIGMLF